MASFCYHPLNPKKQTGQNPDSLHGWPWKSVLRRQPIYGVDRRLGQQAADGQKPLHLTDDFTEQQGRELTKNLSELRSHILGGIAKDPEHAMTKTRLEKIIYSFHHPRSLTTGRCVRSPRIARRLHRPLHARDGGGHPAEHPQTPLRPLDHQELQRGCRAVRRVLQSQTQAVRLCRHRPEVLRRLRRLVHRQNFSVNRSAATSRAEDHHARPARRVCTTTGGSRAASSAC